MPGVASISPQEAMFAAQEQSHRARARTGAAYPGTRPIPDSLYGGRAGATDDTAEDEGEDAQAGTNSATDKSMRRQAEKLMKEYAVRSKLLRKDLDMEQGGIAGAGGALVQGYILGVYVLWELIQVVGLVEGNLLEIVFVSSWLVPVITTIEYLRTGKYVLLRYADVDRQIARVKTLTARAIFRLIVRTVLRVMEWVPFLAAVPWLSLTHAAEAAYGYYQKFKLWRLKRNVESNDQAVQQAWQRAKTGDDKLATAQQAVHTIKNFDKIFAGL